MTTPSTPRKAGPLLGTGAQTAWPFTFKVFAASDIAVTIANNLGVETALVLNADYSVTLNSNQDTSPGGTVTYPISGSALPTGSRLTIFGNLPYDQPLDLPSGGNFSPLALENQLDRLTMQIQQLREQVGRAVQVSVTTSANVGLPAPSANELIGWDSSGDNLQNYALSELATAVAYATMRYDTFTGDGVETEFTLTADPAVLANLDVAISGVTQVPGTDYSLVAGTLVFTSAPPNGAVILARYGEGLVNVSADSSDVRFLQAGSGAIATTVQAKLQESVSVKDFGAVGDGVANDTDAFAAAAAYINAQDGGKLVIPPGTYIVGKQDFAGATGLGYSYRPRAILKIENCTQPVIIEGFGAKLKLANGLKFGSFDPVTGAVYNPPSMPFVNTDYRAWTGIMLEFKNNANVRVMGGIELDGNIANQTIGGTWGDTGRQLIDYGVWAYNNDICTIENVWSHHHCLDGMASGYDTLTAEAGEAKPLTIIDCVFENNARQGWSVTGGRGVTAINCKFNNTGKDIPFTSAPGAGCDLEAETGRIRDVLFLDCEFQNNAGPGLVADSGNAASVTSIRCKFIGTTATPLWPNKPRMAFHDCLIVGSAVNPYASATEPDDATKFYNCKFTDQTVYSPTAVVFDNGYLADFNSGANVLLDGCTFYATTQRNLNLSNGVLRNSFFVCQAARANQDFLALLTNVFIENLTVLDQIVSPAADGYYIAFSSVKYQGVNFINSPSSKIKWWTWSAGGGGASGYLGQSNPNQVAYPYLSVIKGGGDALLGYYGTADTYWGTAAPLAGTYKRGDRFFNSEPTAGQPKSWVCTVAGTPGTWTSEGNL